MRRLCAFSRGELCHTNLAYYSFIYGRGLATIRGRVVAPGLFCAIGLLAVRIDDCVFGSLFAVRKKRSDPKVLFAASAFAGFDVRDSGDGFDRVESTLGTVFSSENED